MKNRCRRVRVVPGTRSRYALLSAGAARAHVFANRRLVHGDKAGFDRALGLAHSLEATAAEVLAEKKAAKT